MGKYETFIVKGPSPISSVSEGELARISEDISAQHTAIAEAGGKLVGQVLFPNEGGYLFLTAQLHAGAPGWDELTEAAQASHARAIEAARSQQSDD